MGQVATNAFNGIAEGEDMDLDSVRAVGQRLDHAVVAHAATDVLSDALVGADLAVGLLLVFRFDDSADSLSSFLSLKNNSLSGVDFQFVHFGLSDDTDGVVIDIVRDLLHGELVRTLPVVEDSGR